jgi:uncharacterized protein (TIGR02145 family)
MKKMSFPLLLSALLSLSVMGQKSMITLTFTAAYYQGTYIQLDSIRVSNNTQGVDTVLFYPDTVLVLGSNVGIPGYKMSGDGFRVIQNYPNPFTSQTKISIFVPKKDEVEISVADVGGRSLLKTDWQLDRGVHSFNFTAGETGLLFLTATWEGINSTIKILSEGTANPQNVLTYAGFEGTGSNLKSEEQASVFVFTPGDSLIYIGYANTPDTIKGSAVLEDKPQNSKTYLFEIVEGIPCPDIPAVSYGGQIYTTVQIGTQCWMAQNLNIGTRINGSQNQANNSIVEKYCYNDIDSSCDIYGGLYQWNEAMQYVATEGVQGICPSGWHIPTDAEWTTISSNLGGLSVAGGKMKETSLNHWASPNTGATNISGFTALGAGYRSYIGAGFYDLKVVARFWTSTQNSTYPGTAWIRYVYHYQRILIRDFFYNPDGWSIRCIKN